MNPYTLSKALDNKQNEIFLNLTTQKKKTNQKKKGPKINLYN